VQMRVLLTPKNCSTSAEGSCLNSLTIWFERDRQHRLGRLRSISGSSDIPNQSTDRENHTLSATVPVVNREGCRNFA